MDVDKAGHHHQSGAVDDAVRLARETLAEMDDAVVGKGEVDVAAIGLAAGDFVPGDDLGGVLDQGGWHSWAPLRATML
jgi:hypothetical protein